MKPLRTGQRHLLLLALIVVPLAQACTTLAPPTVNPRDTEMRAELPFAHDDFDAFLRRFVDAGGRVDYQAAATDRADLDRYLASLAATSPDNAPSRFPTPEHQLAYWLNAYNASAIALVLNHYPIASVRDVRRRPLTWILPRGAGFFLLKRVVLGGARTTLYGLENVVVRKRFADPRIHFALNCASGGCPKLPAEAFSGERLEEQLQRETTQFLAEPRNARVDASAGRLELSSIFDWYERDFTDWLEAQHPEIEPDLAAYVRLVGAPELRAAIEACGDCRTWFGDYDWTLNDQNRPGAPR